MQQHASAAESLLSLFVNQCARRTLVQLQRPELASMQQAVRGQPLQELDLSGFLLLGYDYQRIADVIAQCGVDLQLLVLPQVWHWTYFKDSRKVWQCLHQLTRLHTLDASGACNGADSWMYVGTAITALCRLRELALDGENYAKFCEQSDQDVFLIDAALSTWSSTRLPVLTRLRCLHLDLTCCFGVNDADLAKEVDASAAQSTQKILLSLQQLTQLRHLSLSLADVRRSHKVAKPDRRSMRNIQGLTQLRSLTLHSMPAIVAALDFSALPQLAALTADWVCMQRLDSLALHLSGCTQLTRLRLEHGVSCNAPAVDAASLRSCVDGDDSGAAGRKLANVISDLAALAVFEAVDMQLDNTDLLLLAPRLAQLQFLHTVDLTGNAEVGDLGIASVVKRTAHAGSMRTVKLCSQGCMVSAKCKARLAALLPSMNVSDLCQW